MSRISKEIATQVAIKLTEKSKAVVDALNQDYSQLITDLYEAQIPKEVKEIFAKYPDWFYTRSMVDFSGHGFSWAQVQTTKPVICNSGTSANLEMNSKVADKIIKAKHKLDKARENYKQLQSETEQALIALKTHKNIEEHLPAAVPFLPPPISNALVVNFDTLKKKLNRQPEVSKEVTNA